MSEQDGAQQWRISMSLISLLLLASGCMFVLGAWLATPAADFRGKLIDKSINYEVEGAHRPEVGDEDDASQSLLTGGSLN
jgi:lipopolysaccharide export LptBFGC system permease protein LptF